MKYIPIEEYPKAWIFRHRELPVDADDLQEIKPMTVERSEQIWSEHVSRESLHPEHFAEGDWAADDSVWCGTERWQSAWDSALNNLPLLLEEHLGEWDDNTTVYFCYESEHVLETKWGVFRRNWKNFLFFDNGPVLLGRKRKQVAQFFENGQYRIGNRS